MRHRSRARSTGRRLHRAGFVPPDPHAILTVTDSGVDNGTGGTWALYTTAAPHGLSGGGVTVVGTSNPAAYDGAKNVDAVPSPTTWYEAGTTYVGNAHGGRWS